MPRLVQRLRVAGSSAAKRVPKSISEQFSKTSGWRTTDIANQEDAHWCVVKRYDTESRLSRALGINFVFAFILNLSTSHPTDQGANRYEILYDKISRLRMISSDLAA
jgi:hypothetical protein